MKMRSTSLVCILALTTSCSAKYESFTAGDGKPNKTMLQKAAMDLVDSYAAFSGTGNIRLHIAKNDTVLAPAIEQRLRVNGFSVFVVGPRTFLSGSSKHDEGIDVRYRASYFGNIGTYCLGIGEAGSKIMCRMYEGSEPISSITTRGFKNKAKTKQIPVKDDRLLDDDVRIAKNTSKPTMGNIREMPATISESAVLGRIDPPDASELSIIETANLNNDQLRSVVERYTAYLPQNAQGSFDADKRPGETEEVHRRRLLKQMRIVYSYQYHKGIGYE